MRIPINTFPRNPKLDFLFHGDQVIQLGSCFSTEVSVYFRRFGFAILDNPFGVVFHPIPIANQVISALNKEIPAGFLQREDVHLHYEASSSVYDFSKEALQLKMEEQYEDLLQQLKTAKLITITFGSAHGYRLQSSGEIVGNCHQQPKNTFHKECSELSELWAIWKNVIEKVATINPDLKWLFTVSPVRYSRDGWIENNRSKARLLQLCEKLEELPNVVYFPSYELVIDLLRDYRFYKQDEVHPNELATMEVWEHLKQWLFDEKTLLLFNQIEELRAMETHRMLFPTSKSAEKFRESLHKKRESFLSLYAKIIW